MSKNKRSRRKKKRRTGGSSPPNSSIPTQAEPKQTDSKTVKKSILSPFRILIIAVVAVLLTGTILVLKSGKHRNIRRDEKMNVLLITLDTTRSDRLGCYGYEGAKTPNLDNLARNGVRFDQAYCPVPLTLPSHSSLFTGTNPIFHQVRNNGTYTLAPEYTTLSELLKARDFTTAAFTASFSVDSRFGLDQGFDVYDDNFQEGAPFKSLNAERSAEKVFDLFSSWLDSRPSAPFFSWVHFFDPHLPYSPPPPFREEFSDRPYDGEIAYMDFYIGKIISKLKSLKLSEDTLIVIAGDHGESLGEKGEIGHGIFLYEPSMRVPLIFYAENHLPQGEVVTTLVRLIDVLPTILDLLKLEPAAGVQGSSLLPYIQGTEKKDLDTYIETYYPRENFGWSESTGLIYEKWKYIRTPDPELFDLAADPREEFNLFQKRPDQARELSRRLDDLIRQNASAAAASRRDLSSDEQEKLRALGYISVTNPGDEGPLPDPKEKIGELRLYQQAEMLEHQGKFEEAEALHRQILALRPGASSSYINLALAQARQKKFEDALETLHQGIAANPDSEALLSRLGHTYFVMGRPDEAFDTMSNVLRINPSNMDALTASAVILDAQGEKDQAGDFFERALGIEPENKFLRMSSALNLATRRLIPEAVAAYSGLIKDYPEEAALYQYLGIAYAVGGNFPDAITNLEQAIRLRPTPIAYLNLALALKETGRIKEAVRNLELYLQDPQDEDQAKINGVRMLLKQLKGQLQK